MIAQIILSKSESEKVRKISFLKVSTSTKEVPLPTQEELLRMAFQRISNKGFSIERVAPNDANCIIRVFSKHDYSYDNEIYNLCGFNFFTKKFNGWMSISTRGDDFQLDYAKSLHRLWLYQDEYLDLECDFFDCYVQVNKNIKVR